MSFLRYVSIFSFKKLNPDWNVTVIRRRNPSETKCDSWNEKPDFLHFKGKDYANKLNNLDVNVLWLEDIYPEISTLKLPELHMGDLMQWRVLNDVGGVFSDTDILYFKPMDFEKIKNIDIGLVSFNGNPKPGYIPTSFVIGRPNQFFSVLCEKAKDIDYSDWEAAGTSLIHRVFGDFNSVKDAFPDKNVQRIDSKLFFPFSETDYPFVQYFSLMFFENIPMPEQSIGIHWYGSSRISQFFNNSINSENYTKQNNTICNLIKQLYK